jgi:hypothetical protein
MGLANLSRILARQWPKRNDDDGYLDVRRAIERIDADESYRSVASDVPNLARTTLDE